MTVEVPDLLEPERLLERAQEIGDPDSGTHVTGELDVFGSLWGTPQTLDVSDFNESRSAVY